MYSLLANQDVDFVGRWERSWCHRPYCQDQDLNGSQDDCCMETLAMLYAFQLMLMILLHLVELELQVHQTENDYWGNQILCWS